MREKILYSSAIVSNELYVERYADRKLQDVIKRMSKPAYVSVARQMGKTNLLIHTKRLLEDENNRYVYIDVTSDFKNAQDCFRYIVNQILNSNEDIKEFELAKEKIFSSRKESVLNPSEEYQNEIREILKSYKGNLIIFLDEVDDLRKHNFSDDIFGQIRKTYFIRETYSVLNRVAYILSGVIDPEKLIKTKENSPFNIAIPIYLEDFNKDEFYELVYKSELELDSDIKDYIFGWLSGNPRMSFEILSLVEDQYLKGVKITNELVDEIIHDFYLTKFKNPPIDHIRDLIINNSDVRKALRKLKKGLIDELADEDINKFYLFGITASKINRQNLKIKNKVLELSLSDEWLDKIELKKKGYYELGNEKIKDGEYLEGIQLLQEYVENDLDAPYFNFANYNIGKAYHEFGDYESSNKYLLKHPISKETSTEYYYWQIFYIGINYFKLKMFDDALVCYDEIIDDNKISQAVINAYVNKGETLIDAEKKYEIEDITNVYLSAIDYLNDNDEKITSHNTFKSVIYYRLGFLNQYDNKKEEAIVFLEKAREFSKIEEQPIILLYIDRCVANDLDKRIEIYKEIFEIIIGNNLVTQKSSNLIMPFYDVHLYLILINLYDFKLVDEFETLFNYSKDKIYLNRLKEHELLLEVAFFALNNNNIVVSEHLMRRILSCDNTDLKTEMICNQFLASVTLNKDFDEAILYLENYVRIFDQNKNFGSQLHENDFRCFIELINYYRSEKKYSKSYEISNILEPYFVKEMDATDEALSVTILFFIMDFYSITKNYKIAESYGVKILDTISSLKLRLAEINEPDIKGLLHLEIQTNNFLQKLASDRNLESYTNSSLFVKEPKEPGRNEIVSVKYKDGRLVKIKFKKVILDLKAGKCDLI